MTVLVAALLFGVSGVVGVTAITLASLSYAKWSGVQEAALAEEDRCATCYKWHKHKDKSGTNFYTVRARCERRSGHDGPHCVRDIRHLTKGQDLWFEDDHPRVLEADIP